MSIMIRAAAAKQILVRAMNNPAPLSFAARTMATAVARMPSKEPPLSAEHHVHQFQGLLPGGTTFHDLVEMVHGNQALLVGLPRAFPERTWPSEEPGEITEDEVFVFGVEDTSKVKAWHKDHNKELNIFQYVCHPSPELSKMLKISKPNTVYIHRGYVHWAPPDKLPEIGHAFMDALHIAALTNNEGIKKKLVTGNWYTFEH